MVLGIGADSAVTTTATDCNLAITLQIIERVYLTCFFVEVCVHGRRERLQLQTLCTPPHCPGGSEHNLGGRNVTPHAP